uniref:Uncharacterized protein n=1 Tax=Ditylenchus dipsaci TaxID=166011 RepID=A0A915EGA1_9BILA
MSSGEVLSDVKFDENLVGPQSSLYVKPLRMHFVRKIPKLNQSIKLSWDMALEQDSVAASCVRSASSQKAENQGKSLNSIEWTKYPISMGETAELCAAGRYRILKTYLTGIGISGSSQHLSIAKLMIRSKQPKEGDQNRRRIH